MFSLQLSPSVLVLDNSVKGPVIIVEYDAQWPQLYEVEKHFILRMLSRKVRAIEHIGSTAVPGLGAKPIIDIMVGVRSAHDADECIPVLQNNGYTDIVAQPDNDEWFYCCGKGPHRAAYHLHLVKFTSTHWKDRLRFRDYLRHHAETAQQYCDLKKELSAQYRSDRDAYTVAKTSFINEVLAKASHI